VGILAWLVSLQKDWLPESTPDAHRYRMNDCGKTGLTGCCQDPERDECMKMIHGIQRKGKCVGFALAMMWVTSAWPETFTLRSH
jgi:hypothetical protein